MALLIKEIFKKEFKKIDQHVLNIKSVNFEITINEIKNLKQEISKLKSNLNFTEEVLGNKVEKLEESLKDVDLSVRGIYESQVNPNYVLEKLTKLEDRLRRKNLCIDGINEEKGKIWEMCETRIKNIFQKKSEIREDFMSVLMERAGKKQPRTTVIKLANYKDRSMILRKVHKLKGSGINKDFSKQNTELRKGLWKKVKQLRSEDKLS